MMEEAESDEPKMEGKNYTDEKLPTESSTTSQSSIMQMKDQIDEEFEKIMAPSSESDLGGFKLGDEDGVLSHLIPVVPVVDRKKLKQDWQKSDMVSVGQNCDTLRELLHDNIRYFAIHPLRSQKFYRRFVDVLKLLDIVEERVVDMAGRAHVFDFSREVRHNGFRSLVRIFDEIVVHLKVAAHECKNNRGGFFIMADDVYKRVSDHFVILAAFSDVLKIGTKILDHSMSDCLFSYPPEKTQATLDLCEEVDISAFYTSQIAFQYDGALKLMMEMILLAMAGYGDAVDAFQNPLLKGISSALSFGKYFLFPHQKSQKLVSQLKNGSVEFVQSFWNLMDETMLRHMPQVMGPILGTYKKIFIPGVPIECPAYHGKGSVCVLPDVVNEFGDVLRAHEGEEGFVLSTTKLLAKYYSMMCNAITPEELLSASSQIKEEVDVLACPVDELRALKASLKAIFALKADRIKRSVLLPTVSTPQERDTKPSFGLVKTRLMCFREIKPNSTKSKGLLIHFHGGGFIANSSKSHETYLRPWAVALDVPILSVDYSLAPASPFPRALNECFAVYCWAMNNLDMLGSTGERIVVTGDSAGGNLCVSVALRAIIEGIRTPDVVVPFYPALNVEYSAAPSRLLSLMDPLLAYGILKFCLNAYSADGTVDDSFHLMSPLHAKDHHLLRFPETFLVAVAFDPLLDDSVEFAKRLRDLKRPLRFNVAENVPHGFLNFHSLNDATKHAYGFCLGMLKSAFFLSPV